MRAFVKKDVIGDLIQIWLVEERIHNKERVTVEGVQNGELTLHCSPWPEGGSVQPSLVMGREMFEAILRAGSDIMPPDAGTERHLKDAIAVRDRLLAIVEKVG